MRVCRRLLTVSASRSGRLSVDVRRISDLPRSLIHRPSRLKTHQRPTRSLNIPLSQSLRSGSKMHRAESSWKDVHAEIPFKTVQTLPRLRVLVEVSLLHVLRDDACVGSHLHEGT